MSSSDMKSQLASLKKRVKTARPTEPEVTIPVLAESDTDGKPIRNTKATESNEPRDTISEAKTDGSVGKAVGDWKEEFQTETKPSMRKPVPIVKWACTECSSECIPIMRESRCLCGHRMKEHHPSSKDNMQFPCSSAGCKCKHFFYVVAEGSWVLHCRCKHKHTDHDCAPGLHKCSKCIGSKSGDCSGFDSPWVCNCGHSWGSHQQSSMILNDDNIDSEIAKIDKRRYFFRQDGLPDDEK
jgi:hypothetical protein